jgi:hypothetical protein
MKYLIYVVTALILIFNIQVLAFSTFIAPDLESQIKVIQGKNNSLSKILLRRDNTWILFYEGKAEAVRSINIKHSNKNKNIIHCFVVYDALYDDGTHQEVTYFNINNQEISPTYLGNSLIDDSMRFIIEPNVTQNKEGIQTALIIHPLFKEKGSVRMIIIRDFNLPFPGLNESTKSQFDDKGNLDLVISGIQSSTEAHQPEADQFENIPIDYSKFKNATSKPICWAIPLNHKLRPCNDKERAYKTTSGWGGD